VAPRLPPSQTARPVSRELLVDPHCDHRWDFPCCAWSPFLLACRRQYPGRSDDICPLVRFHLLRPSHESGRVGSEGVTPRSQRERCRELHFTAASFGDVKGRKELSWHGLHLIFELNAKRQRGKCAFTVIEEFTLNPSVSKLLQLWAGSKSTKRDRLRPSPEQWELHKQSGSKRR
jgi:hypothetical protein